MPYIKEDERADIDAAIVPLHRVIHKSSGHLNYAITTLLLTIVDDKGESYALYESLLGTLESVKQEFYRRKVAPYEDGKREQNGDVF